MKAKGDVNSPGLIGEIPGVPYLGDIPGTVFGQIPGSGLINGSYFGEIPGSGFGDIPGSG